MAENKDYYVGVDLGGTKILAAVFTQGLKCVGKCKRRTKAERGPQVVVNRVAGCVLEAIEECDLDVERCCGVGLGAPGAVDFEAGKVIFAPNLGWKSFPLKKELEKRLNRPVFVENDCNVATLGVYEVELARKPRSLVGMFIGTGIGGGIVLDAKPYAGTSHTAGEIGHMIVQVNGPKCGCGRRGCLEALASRTAMLNRIRAAVADGETTALTKITGDDLSSVKSSHLRKAAQQRDKLVTRVLQEAARCIGIGAANLINVLNPDYLVVGGGVIQALEGEMFETIVRSASDYIFPGAERGLKIIASQLGDDAGITGAAVLARQHTG
jgi:glucokinase